MKIKASMILTIILLSNLFIANILAEGQDPYIPPDFVIPENPLGTFGALMSIIIAAGLVVAKKRGLLRLRIDN
jgi:hypothetical protein